MSITGAVDGDPVKVGVAIADVIAGLSTATAVQAALRHAERTGNGQHIDIALLDTQIAALVNIASNYLVSGENPSRYGNQHQNIVPYQTFAAADKKFVLAVGNDRQFRLMCHLIQAPDLAEDSRFKDNPSRVAHRDELVNLLSDYFVQRPAAEWVDLLLDAGIPAGPINTVEEALNDPHIQSRGMIQQTELSSGEMLRYVASPLNLSQTPPQYHTPPPAHGEHTAHILKAHLSLSDDDIHRLRETGVI
jgi:crotonobetainyl-CoA:carnitine CoA-transferase CaiB-like acyl-CoA transferase